ncbi:glutaredoxin family protein [Bacillus massilinigeriensis]|uniref:glutaredoxin family protein n=1 Tax=Bacillus mediterraneensis TaxID=1805474 RepID=UPI0008F84461|nr:glutaredoxin family protein [Bacillus mediterraneensis]
MKGAVTLYMREKCHLCSDAKEMLQSLQEQWDFSIVEVDIDNDDDLVEQYGITIPVVVLNGEEIAWGIVDKNAMIKAFSEKNIDYIG